jgi:5'-deoxynucleotidase YfbR-like HD superfamily hydrolase
MSFVRRWSHAHCAKHESVLEHTAVVSMCAYGLCIKHGYPYGTVLEKALRKEISKIEEEVVSNICEEYFDKRSEDAWFNAKDLETVSGNIIAICDTAAVVYKIWIEVNLGNSTFLEYKSNVNSALLLLMEKVMDDFKEDVKELIDFLGDIK